MPSLYHRNAQAEAVAIQATGDRVHDALRARAILQSVFPHNSPEMEHAGTATTIVRILAAGSVSTACNHKLRTCTNGYTAYISLRFEAEAEADRKRSRMGEKKVVLDEKTPANSDYIPETREVSPCSETDITRCREEKMSESVNKDKS